jgi:hypothetical protein
VDMPRPATIAAAGDGGRHRRSTLEVALAHLLPRACMKILRASWFRISSKYAEWDNPVLSDSNPNAPKNRSVVPYHLSESSQPNSTRNRYQHRPRQWWTSY